LCNPDLEGRLEKAGGGDGGTGTVAALPPWDEPSMQRGHMAKGLGQREPGCLGNPCQLKNGLSGSGYKLAQMVQCKTFPDWAWWPTPVLPATWEAEIKEISIQGQGEKLSFPQTCQVWSACLQSQLCEEPEVGRHQSKGASSV
jgi:hypothetical protein